jgi:hypothetical protein
MKRLITLLTIATLLLGCRKTKEISIVYDVFGLKNGVDWKASSHSVMTKQDTLDIGASTYDQHGESSELIFSKILLSKGKQLLFGRNANHAWTAFYTVIGGDVLEGVYIPCETQNNFIEIQEIDPCRKYIKGIFQVTLMQDTISKPHKYIPYLPDTIRFTNGVFSSYYK